jgi:hypothetical protein
MVNLRRTYNEPYQRIVSFLLPIIMKNKIQWDIFFVWAVALSISELLELNTIQENFALT